MDSMRPAQRRKAMQNNRGRTVPERRFAKALWHLGYRYLTSDGYRRRFDSRILGSPDIILASHGVLIFVDGCFWHGCERCHDFRSSCSIPWQEKIEQTRLRDARIRGKLRGMGWRVWRVWEHDLRRRRDFERSVARIDKRLSLLGRAPH